MLKDFLMHDEEVAEALDISVPSLRNKVSAGDPLPPYRQPDLCRARIWLVEDFKKWVLSLPAMGCSGTAQAPVPDRSWAKKKRQG